MYNFDEQVNNSTSDSSRGSGFYREKVNIVRMKVDEGADIMFKILPAIDTQTAKQNPDGTITADMNSWTTFRDIDGRITPWGRVIYTSPFTGHGKEGKGGNRREFISLKCYSSGDDGQVFCPLQTLIDTINRESMWKYLTEDVKDPYNPNVTKERKAIGYKLNKKMLCNIIDVRKPDEGVILAEFPTSAVDSLFSQQPAGVACNLNYQATPEAIAANPMIRWVCGDMTDIGEMGPVLAMKKAQEKNKARGKFTPYIIELAVNMHTRQLYRYALPPDVLQFRYNLLDLNSIIPRPKEENMIQEFIGIFNQWDPTGRYHEYELLKTCFGSMVKIPEPPARNSSMSFSQPAMQQAPQSGFGQPQQQFGQPPQFGQPMPQQGGGFPQQGGFQPQIPQAPNPVFGSHQGGFQPQPQAMQPMQPMAQPAGMTVQTGSGLPASFQPQVPQAPQIPQIPQVPMQAAPALPGDPVVFNKDTFMSQIKNNKPKA